MNKKSALKFAVSNVIAVILLAGTISALFGCKSGPPKPNPIKLNVKFQTTERAASLTIPVYVGAGNQTYDKSLLEEPVDQILERIRSTQSLDIKTFQLASGGTNISRLDPKWDLWLRQKNADHLVVIADLPKNFGGENRRRQVIPLEKRLWRHLSSDKTIHVEILESGVKLIDSPRL